MPDLLDVAALDELAPAAAAAALAPCCASERWAAQLVAGRPHVTLDRLARASDAALAALDWPGIEQALAAHPRIGSRPGAPGREAAWSAREQQSALQAGQQQRDDLAAANAAYEERFGWVFLICATGRSAGEMLAQARRRLGNDPAAERAEVRAELRAIVALRLAKAFR